MAKGVSRPERQNREQGAGSSRMGLSLRTLESGARNGLSDSVVGWNPASAITSSQHRLDNCFDLFDIIASMK